jgi:hypothetical protein
MLRLVSLGSVCLLALAAGCGNSVDHASAVKVMNSALTGTVTADGQLVKLDWTPSGGHLDVAVTNPVGTGSAEVVGTVTRNGNVTNETVDITFKQWNDPVHHVTLDGVLHETGAFSSPLPLSGDVQLSGALAVSGDVNATVDFDLAGNYSPSGFKISGDVGGNTIDGSFSLSSN